MIQSRVLLAALASPFFLLAGCSESEPLRSYSVPAEARPVIRQIEGAIVLVDDNAWFFKVEGTPEIVERHRSELPGFLKSLEFGGENEDEKELAYELPAGWQILSTNRGSSGAVGEGPFAEIKLAANRPLPKLVITRLHFRVPEAEEERGPGEAKYILDNVNRWRRQVALPSLEASELGLPGEAFQTKTGQEGLLFSMVGQAEAAGRRPPAQRMFDFDAENYELPAGWTAAPNDQFSKLAFTTGADDSIRITVTPLAGGGENALLARNSNIERWQDQLGLAERPEGSVSEPQEVDGHTTYVVNLASTESVQESNGQLSAGPVRIVGAIIAAEGSLWVIRMKGPDLPVQEELPNFHVFLKSTKFKPLPRR